MLKYHKKPSLPFLSMMKTKEEFLDGYFREKDGVGIYIHLPYCEKRCLYCDFLSFTSYEGLETYFDHILKEIYLYKGLYGSKNIKTIYFGGGTPSSVDPTYIGNILQALDKDNHIAKDAEISLEANPESMTRDRAGAYKAYGINRISMGCQSFNDKFLKSLGRIHNEVKIYQAVDAIRGSGINNLNLDLIYGLPGQGLSDLKEDLDKITGLEPDHISAYSLILEEETPLYKMAEKGNLDLVSDEDDRFFYHYGVEFLEAKGYKRYEISNFAKAERESRHNLCYWKSDYYIGLGLGSSSFFNRKRYKNFDDFTSYYQALDVGRLPITEVEPMDYERLKTDYILMGMRLARGIDRKEYKKNFGLDFYEDYKDLIDEFVNMDEIVVDENNIYFTLKGVDVSNRFFIEII